MRARFPLSSHRRRRVAEVLRDRRGTSTVEYALILAFIVLMMLGALTQVATTTRAMWIDIASRFVSAR